MKLFKNGVGRPSNEIKQKRRNFITGIVIVVGLLVIAGIYTFDNFTFVSLKGTSYIKGKKIYLSNAPRYISYKSKIKVGTLSGYYYIYNASVKNGRIRISKTSKGSSLGWVLEKDIKNSANEATQKYVKNEQIRLNNTKIYTSYNSKSVKSKKTGNFYIYNALIKNGRIRITSKINGKLTGWVNVSDIIKYGEYKDNPFWMGNCYTEESVLANNYKVAKNVKVGDKVVCPISFELNPKDAIKQLSYTLTYGKGLDLIKVEKYNSKVNGKNYSLTLKKPTSVGEFIGDFTFEVVDTKYLSYGIKNIRFVTSDNRYYSTSNLIYKLDSYPKYERNPFNIGCYTEESVLANNYEVAKNVKIGDKVVCSIGFETNASDKIKKLNYTLSYGNGLKLIKVEKYNSIVNGENYSLTLKEPTSVGEFIGDFTFEVVDTEKLGYGIKNIAFETVDSRYYSTDDISQSFNSN